MKNFSIVLAYVLTTIASCCISVGLQAKDLNSLSKHELGAGFGFGDAFLTSARYGYNINENLRIEGEASTGETLELFSETDNIDYWVSALIVGRLPYGDYNSAFFLRAGSGVSKATAPAFTSQTPLWGPINTSYPSLSVSGNVLHFGFGIEHFFNNNYGLRFEGNYTNDSSFDKITEAVGREKRESALMIISTSLVYRF